MILHFPRDVVQVFRDSMVAKRHPHFQSPIHAHPVFPVKQRLHKPVGVQPHHLPHPLFQRRVIRQQVGIRKGHLFPVVHIFIRLDAGQVFRTQEAAPPAGGLRPWEPGTGTDFRVTVPGVSAEQLVGTFSRQCDGYIFSNLLAEKQQRGIDIRHTRQVTRIDCVH